MSSCFALLGLIFREYLGEKGEEFLEKKTQEFAKTQMKNQISIACKILEDSKLKKQEERKQQIEKISLLSFGKVLKKMEEIPEAINEIKDRNFKDFKLGEFLKLKILNDGIQRALTEVINKTPKFVEIPLSRFKNVTRKDSYGDWLRLAAITDKITNVTIDELIRKLQFNPNLLLKIIEDIGPERLLNDN
jgi:hypothetical protein